MDIATILGLIATLGIIMTSILLGGPAGMFINIPSLLIVVGGTATVTMMKYPLAATLGAFKVALIAFFYKSEDANALITQGIELATLVRKEGVLALESVEVENDFLAKGLQLTADGHEPEFVKRILENDINLGIARHDLGKSIFKGIGDAAPAMGMIGTLIGLVQMMANMSDPASIGPAMAVALLTTLYGAVIANVMALPVADKLGNRSDEERLKKTLVLETISAIQLGMNPRVLEDLLKTFLPTGQRGEIGEEEKEAA